MNTQILESKSDRFVVNWANTEAFTNLCNEILQQLKKHALEKYEKLKIDAYI